MAKLNLDKRSHTFQLKMPDIVVLVNFVCWNCESPCWTELAVHNSFLVDRGLLYFWYFLP